MADELGTRIKASLSNNRSDSSDITRSFTRDLGMSKLVTDSMTFASATARITGIAGDFSNFATFDPIFVAGANLNNGQFVITAIAGDGSYIVVDPPPKDEGPISVTIRTT